MGTALGKFGRIWGEDGEMALQYGMKYIDLLALAPLANRAGVSNPWPMGCMWPRMAMNVAQHKIINLLNTV